jgi:hypothetical protein
VVLFTIGLLVPVNNRIASLNTAELAPGWKNDHRKWRSPHRVRILLAAAVIALTYALVG